MSTHNILLFKSLVCQENLTKLNYYKESYAKETFEKVSSKINKSFYLKKKEYDNHLERFFYFMNKFFRIENERLQLENNKKQIEFMNNIEKIFDDFKDKNIIDKCIFQITDIILMVQEEVAKRMTATENSPSKQYGLLTIMAQFWADVKIIKFVGRKSFYPAPKVNSALVKLVVREKPLIDLTDYSHFRKTVKSAFSQRRKNIKNCLLAAGFDKNKVLQALKNLDLDENIRGEKLSIKTFGKLSEELLKI